MKVSKKRKSIAVILAIVMLLELSPFMPHVKDSYAVSVTPGLNKERALVVNDESWSVFTNNIAENDVHWYKFTTNSCIASVYKFNFGCNSTSVGDVEFTVIDSDDNGAAEGYRDNEKFASSYVNCSKNEYKYMTFKDLKVSHTYYVKAEFGYMNKGHYDYQFKYTVDIPMPDVKGLMITREYKDSVTLDWYEHSIATGYKVYVNEELRETIDSNTSTITLNDLPSGNIYKFKVQAYKTLNNKTYMSNYSEEVSTFIAPLSKVNGLRVTETTATGALLDWDRYDIAKGYNVYVNGELYTKIDNPRITTANIEGLSAGKVYSFQVDAYTEFREKFYQSEKCEEVMALILPLDAVAGVNVSKTTKSTVTLNWEKHNIATGYNVYVGEELYRRIEDPNTTRMLVEGLNENQVYTFKVQAYKELNEMIYLSEDDQEVCAVTTPISSIVGMQVKKINKTDVRIKWNKHELASGYNLYVNGRLYKKIRKPENTTLDIKNLNKGMIYSFELEAYITLSGKDYSSKKTPKISVFIAPLSNVNSIRVVDNTEKSLTLKWSKPKVCTGYNIYIDGKLYKKIKNDKTTSLKISGLHEGRVYKLQIQVYKEFEGNIYNSVKSSILYGITLPKKVSYSNVKSKPKQTDIRWRAQNVTGYQVEVAENKSFTKSRKVIKTNKNCYTIKRGNKDRSYYIRVRAYKRCNGITKYGKWSLVKQVKVKKLSAKRK